MEWDGYREVEIERYRERYTEIGSYIIQATRPDGDQNNV